MDEATFLNRLGFLNNPFQYTNADEEELLQNYFVPPPYFQSVWGNPQTPGSCIVFAPRGAGKSAQRKIIEVRSLSQPVLAIQYSRFEFPNAGDFQQVNLQYHLKNIIQLALIGFLLRCYETGAQQVHFDKTDRHQLSELCKFYLSGLQPEQVQQAVSAIKTRFDKAVDFLRQNLWAVNALVNAFLQKAGGGTTNIPPSPIGTTIQQVSRTHLDVLVRIITKMGFQSVYILIDKVDETQYTSTDAQASYSLIQPLLRDLETLQISGVGFKFFLWDAIKPHYIKFARPDRIPQFDLNWRSDELKHMMKIRLKAFATHEPAPTFADLLSDEMGAEEKAAVESLTLAFAHGSPRDMIRLCRQMLQEQLRLGEDASKISRQAVKNAFNVFCNERAAEIVPDRMLEEIKKNRRLNFTTSYVASNTFKIDTNSARSKIKNWVNTGVVRRIEDVPTKGGKPNHQFAIVDARVAKSIFPEMSFVDFLRSKVAHCKCAAYVFRDWDLNKEHICHNCKKPPLA